MNNYTKKHYITVINSQQMQEAIEHINNSTVLAYDTETTGLNVRKCKVIGFSFCGSVGVSYYIPHLVWNQETDSLEELWDKETCIDILKLLQNKELLTWNASFDVRITRNYFGVDLLNSVVADVLLMKHTISEDGNFKLKDVAIEYQAKIGLNVEEEANIEQIRLKENIKSKGGSTTKTSFEMYKADLPILGEYANADTDLTLRLGLLFRDRLESEGLEEFFYDQEVMPLYKEVTIPMEDRGIKLDMPMLTSLKQQIEEEIQDCEQRVLEAILSTSEGQSLVRELAEKNCPINNKGSFAQEYIEYLGLSYKFPKLASGKLSLSKKHIESLADVHLEAYKFLTTNEQSNVPLLKEVQLKKYLKDTQDKPINISSKQQMGNLVFNHMHIKALSFTDKKAPQFNEEMIQHLADVHHIEWAKELRVYNKLIKINSSYYTRFLDQQEDGVFYPSFLQHKTTSGRYGSDLQQLPRPLEDGDDDTRVVKYTNTLRALFIPFKDYIFIDDDYESLEPKVFADDAMDQPLLDIFIKGEDFYSKVAIMALGLQGVSANKKDSNFLKNVNPKARQDAKAYSLGIRYGAKAGKVSQLLGIEKEEAQVIVDSYFRAFPKLKNKMDFYLTQAKTCGKVVSKYGRVRHLPRIKEIYSKFGDHILDYTKKYNIMRKYRLSEDDYKNIRGEYNNLLNNALNFPIQSAATSILSRASIAIMRRFREQNIDAWISLVVHDQIVVTCRQSQKEKAAEIVQDCMENTNKIAVPLVAVPQFAYNLKDGH